MNEVKEGQRRRMRHLYALSLRRDARERKLKGGFKVSRAGDNAFLMSSRCLNGAMSVPRAVESNAARMTASGRRDDFAAQTPPPSRYFGTTARSQTERLNLARGDPTTWMTREGSQMAGSKLSGDPGGSARGARPRHWNPKSSPGSGKAGSEPVPRRSPDD